MLKRTERSDSSLRHSIFGIRYSAVRFLNQLTEAGNLDFKRLSHFGVVSYEVSGVREKVVEMRG
jgi:hypothetical protein